VIPEGATIVIGFCLSEPFFITIDLLNYFEKCLAKCVAELKLVEGLLGILLEVIEINLLQSYDKTPIAKIYVPILIGRNICNSIFIVKKGLITVY
jgi:hypothetical protein